MIDKLFPALVLLICLALMARLFLSERLRWRVDAAARRAWAGLRGAFWRLRHWRSSRQDAAREAEEAIRRARDGGSWEGNVYKPKSFTKRPPRNKLH